jgi:hypothetical protein
MPAPTDASHHRGIAVVSKTPGGGWHVCIVKGQDGRGAVATTVANNVELAADQKERLDDLLDRRFVCFLDTRLVKDVPALADVRPVDPNVLIGAALAEQARVALAAADERERRRADRDAPKGVLGQLELVAAPPFEDAKVRTDAFELAQQLVRAWGFWLEAEAERVRRTGGRFGDETLRDLPPAFRERYEVLVLPAGEIVAPPSEDETVEDAVPDEDAPAPVGDDSSGGDDAGTDADEA